MDWHGRIRFNDRVEMNAKKFRNRAPAMLAIVFVLLWTCVLVVALANGFEAALNIVGNAVGQIILIEYELVAAVLGPLRPAPGSQLEGWIALFLWGSTVCGTIWAFYKVYGVIHAEQTKWK